MLNSSVIRSFLSVCIFTIFGLFSSLVSAQVHDQVSPKVKKAILTQLSKVIQNPQQAEVTATPLKELYQVTLGPMVVYMTADGQYLVMGKILDLKNGVNLTERAKAKAVKSALSKVPESNMIIYPAKGQAKHFITVFTDIDCPYCHRLHKEVPKLNTAGITVRYLSYPRAGIGSRSYDKAVSVWCAKDRAEAMNQAMQGKITPRTCQNTVANQFELAQAFQVNGTPTIILESGQIIPGYIPAQKLIQLLNQKK